jgi:hypothetical protein
MKRSAEIKAMSAQQIMDEAGVKNMLEGRTINLQCFGSKQPQEGKLTMSETTRNTMSEEEWTEFQRIEQLRVERGNRKSAEVQLALAPLPRACRFKVGDDWIEGTVHAWSTDFEEYEAGPALYPVGIVEDARGRMHSICVSHITFEPKPEPLIEGRNGPPPTSADTVPPPPPLPRPTSHPRSHRGIF